MAWVSIRIVKYIKTLYFDLNFLCRNDRQFIRNMALKAVIEMEIRVNMNADCNTSQRI